jgi:eukaryotic-like serine/threonine-protein kinase
MDKNEPHLSQNIQDNQNSLNLNSGGDTHIAGDVTNVGGDQIRGDKVLGDKIGGNKYEGGTHYHYPLAPLTPAERQNRANLMTNVRQTWIDGFLKQSLYTEVRLALGKTYEPTAVSRPWNLALHQDHAAPQPIPPDKPIHEIYRQAGSNLLILGEPGSGKTITLLMLAESLLDEAEADEGQPVPVVLNLSSWALRPVPLQEWLVESLHQQYQLSKKYAGELLTQQRVTLLLDGLDEVATDHRAACAEAINAFKAEQQMSVVVCSRVADYEALGKKLNLSHAIQIQPLSQTQIENTWRGMTLA